MSWVRQPYHAESDRDDCDEGDGGTYVRVVMMITERMRSLFTQLTHIYSPTLVDLPPGLVSGSHLG